MNNLYKASLLAFVSVLAFNAISITTCSAMKNLKEERRKDFYEDTFLLICKYAVAGDVKSLKIIGEEVQFSSDFYLQKNISRPSYELGCKFRTDDDDYDFDYVHPRDLWGTLEYVSKKGKIETMKAFFPIVEKILIQVENHEGTSSNVEKSTLKNYPVKAVLNYSEKLEKCIEIAKQNKNNEIAVFLFTKLSEI